MAPVERNPYSAPRAHVDDAAATSSAERPAAPDGPRGIGGWLLLPLLGLIVTPTRVGFEYARDIAPALKPETWEALTTPGSTAYDPMWAPLIVFELIANALIIVFSLVLLVLFLRKYHRVPTFMIVWLLAILGVQIVDFVLASQIEAIDAKPDAQAIRDLGRSLLGVAIWVPYFLRSKRVKNTFKG